MKESEWIVSPKELKRNQERGIERELKKKENVSQIILVAITMIIFAFIIFIISETNKETINNCVKAGNNYDFCVNSTK